MKNWTVLLLWSPLALAQAAASVVTPPMEFVTVQPGSFRMGCSEGDTLCDPDENPAHQVRITKSFQLGKFEVTQEQWKSIMGAANNPSRFKGDTLPAENMTFLQVEEFLKRLNALNDGFKYRLPTEAEWEYAARAGTTGPNTGPINDVAWHLGNSAATTHPVGQKKPNAWGLHDMEGNVYEWTTDWFFDYEEDPQTDPKGPETGFEKVPRGGAFESTPKGIRTSNRNQLEPDGESYLIGFRYVREPARP